MCGVHDRNQMGIKQFKPQYAKITITTTLKW